MSKPSRIMLLVAIIFAITGATNKTFAANQTNICSSSLVSQPTCEASNAKLCIKPASEPQKQIQSAVIIATPAITTAPATPTAADLPTTTPTPTTTAPVLNGAMAADNAVLDSDKIFDLVNQYRQSQNLAPFVKDDNVCQLAQTRSSEIIAEIAGTAGPLHSGLYNRNLPYWIWENAKYGSNEEGTVAWWLASPIHHASIVGDYKYSCVKCTGSYCSELFTSYVNK